MADRTESFFSNLGVGVWLKDAYLGITRPPARQLPLLDVLRTLAIMLVITHHFGASYESHFGQTALTRSEFVKSGWSGVDLFFVLSGFLIGGQLWRQLREFGSISLQQFILRRGLRIWPLFYCTLIAILVFDYLHSLTHQLVWPDALFLSDYYLRATVPGAWSLCIEEQFYVAAPLLLLLFTARKLRQRTQTHILWAIFCALPILRAVEWIRLTGSLGSHQNTAAFGTLYYNFHTHCDGLIIGMILAASQQSSSMKIPQLWKRIIVALCAATTFVLLRKLQPEIFDFTGLALFFGALVWLGVDNNSKLFGSRIFFIASRLSFGMYLNHQLIMFPVMSVIVPWTAHFSSSLSRQLIALSMLIASSALVATFTYFVIEHPFLMLRDVVAPGKAR